MRAPTPDTDAKGRSGGADDQPTTTSDPHGGAHPAPAGLNRRRLLVVAGATVVGGAAALVARPSPADATGSSLVDLARLADPARSGRPDVVADWFGQVVENTAPFNPPNYAQGVADRMWAIVWLSALTALDAGTATPRSSRRGAAFEDAAVATAVHDALVDLAGDDQTGRLDTALEASLAAIPDSDDKRAGIEAGEEAAARVLAERRGDGFDPDQLNRPYTPPSQAPYVYRLPPGATATQGAGQQDARPFLLGRANRFRPPALPDFASAAYVQGLEELRLFGVRGEGSQRDDRQRDIAWLAPGMQYGPALAALLPQLRHPVRWKVQLLAAYATSQADAGIAVSEAKFTYLHWRPVTALREGTPYNPRDATWMSNLPTPANPEYPSGHGAGAGAAERVLEHFVGARTPVAFTVRYTRGDDGGVVNLEYPRGTRWSALTQENVDARVWAGVHWRFSDEAGATLGRRVAAYDLRRLGEAYG